MLIGPLVFGADSAGKLAPVVTVLGGREDSRSCMAWRLLLIIEQVEQQDRSSRNPPSGVPESIRSGSSGDHRRSSVKRENPP
ncbi:hypothetical protein [Amycolatopsis keratiniphila]|uniref:hypothetical protein n=1 Tax=Amycolatopsis keratiniphila TaxID=129921 RepID=UPI000F514C7E|nr:hypothetical protein [Amycolatopsis keratiniphila]